MPPELIHISARREMRDTSARVVFRRRIEERQLRRVALGRWLDAPGDGCVDGLEPAGLRILHEINSLPAREPATHGRSRAGRNRDPLWLPLGLGSHDFAAPPMRAASISWSSSRFRRNVPHFWQYWPIGAL